MKSINLPLLNLCPVLEAEPSTELYLVRVNWFESKYSRPIYLSRFITVYVPCLHWQRFNSLCFTRNHADPDTAVWTTLILKRNMLFLWCCSGMKWPYVHVFLASLEVAKCDQGSFSNPFIDKRGSMPGVTLASAKITQDLGIPRTMPQCRLWAAHNTERAMSKRVCITR